MPTDSKGNFHFNTQRAMASDRMGASPAAKPLPGAKAMPEQHAEEKGGVPEHLQAMHQQMGGKHMHVHSDGFSHTTHHVGEDGQVQGPHEHPDMEALKDHMSNFFEEGQEGSPSAEHEMASGHQKDVY